MTTNIVVPSMGESIVDATVMHWYKQEGDPVNLGEKLVELETDKVNLDVSAEKNGVLQKIQRKEGDDVKVGEVLGVLDESGRAGPNNGTVVRETAKAAPNETAKAPPPEKVESEQTLAPPPAQTPAPESETFTPVARKVAEKYGIQPGEVSPGKPGGKITRQDVEAFVESRTQVLKEPTSKPVEREETAEEAQQEKERLLIESPEIEDREERVLMSRRRRTIAQRLVDAQHTAAMLTTFNDINMSQVMDIRRRRKEEFQSKYGVGLGITSFFIKASVQALREFPRLNSEIQGDSILLKYYYDIGVAVGAEEGLVVPVIRGADKLTFAEIETAIHGFAQKSQSGALSIEDLRGGTFTITNGGVFGSLLSTPILNSPQVAILGLHRIEDRPVAENGQVVIRPMMYAALSYDHRVIDGREAVLFLKRIKELVENTELLLLG